MDVLEHTYTQKYKRLIKAVEDLSMAHTLNEVMEIVRIASRELSGSDGTTFVLREKNMCYYAEENAIMPLWKGARFPLETCISGWVMLYKERAVIPDIYVDNRIPHDAYRPTFVKSLAMIPIRKADPIGAIGNYWAQTHIPTEEDLELLQSLANVTAVTLENIKTNEELEKRVQERTRELEEVNKDLERFSYSISHDLRAPLRSINGFMGILMEDHGSVFNEDAKVLASKVMTNASQMATLINELLLFFKTGRKKQEEILIDMNAMVHSAIEESKELTKHKSVSFVVSKLKENVGDTSLLKQVWLNLISNAIKYSSKVEHPQIEIGSQQENGQVIYFVRDNGAGFDMRFYDKLFGVFQRLHSQREFDGNGIGLAIVEKIIHSHGGKIWAESRLNEGACFYFTLHSD